MKVAALFQVLLWSIYPVVIFFGIRYLEPRYVAMLLALVLAVRWRKDVFAIFCGMIWVPIAVFSTLLLAIVLTTITNNELLLRLYPALVSAGMLLIFGYSLLHPPTMVERFARKSEPELTAQGVRYTRTVTQVWCGFFLLNGGISILTALCASREFWSLYNGLIAYVLMGVVFICEWGIRQRVKRKYKQNI